MSTNHSKPSFNAYQSEDAPFLPERTLAAAIVERAFRDLEPRTEDQWRRKAICWFSSYYDNKPHKYFYSCKNLFELLEFSSSKIQFIKEKLDDAKNLYGATETQKEIQQEIQDRKNGKKKRWQRGVGVGKPTKRKRSISPTNCPMQREAFALAG